MDDGHVFQLSFPLDILDCKNVVCEQFIKRTCNLFSNTRNCSAGRSEEGNGVVGYSTNGYSGIHLRSPMTLRVR